MTEVRSVKIVDSALQETAQGDIILRGIIDPTSLQNIQVDDYQREILTNKKKVQGLKRGILMSTVPDIDVGMRGERYVVRSDAMYLQDPVFVIDGLQRLTAAKLILADSEVDQQPFLGAKVHFGTTEESEREMFEDLNLGQTKLSSNVTLRNKANALPAADALFRLTNNSNFVLCGQVSWDQNMKRQELITAYTMIRTVGMLHSHAGPGRGSNVLDLINGVQKIYDNVGRGALVANVKTFFDVIDQSWGVRRVYFRGGATYLKASFLMTLARVFSDHTNFWQDDKLTVDTATIKKLQQFPIDDPEVSRIASSSGASEEMLYMLIVKRINSGRRTRRLQSRRTLRDVPVEENDYELDCQNGGDDQ